MKDLVAFFEKGDVVSQTELNNRKDFYFLIYDKGEISFCTGDKGRKMKSDILDKFLPNEIKEFKGAVANKGKVEGKVRVIRFDDLRKIEEEARNIQEKFILVTGMTNPNMVPLLKKAKAIVTDEGGITCHAAIISREFGIPCVIGTRIATKVLKDGMLIEVDANTGIVRIIESR